MLYFFYKSLSNWIRTIKKQELSFKKSTRMHCAVLIYLNLARLNKSQKILPLQEFPQNMISFAKKVFSKGFSPVQGNQGGHTNISHLITESRRLIIARKRDHVNSEQLSTTVAPKITTTRGPTITVTFQCEPYLRCHAQVFTFITITLLD